MNQTTTMQSATSKGYALVTALIFLVLLTLVALAAIKGTGLEAKMSGNNTLRAQAFESSELSRTLLDYTLIDGNTFNRGWPNSTTVGGSLPVSQFDPGFIALLASSSACSDGFCISKDSSSKPIDWWSGNTECPGSGSCTFKPNNLDVDATYKNSVAFGSSTSITTPVAAQLSVFKLYTSLGSGAGAAMSSGYLGLGRGAAAGGSNIYYYASSTGHEAVTAPQASTQTAAVFRDVVRN